MNFANKVVLVTGGSAGIGAATAILFAKEGANVAIVGRNEAKLNNVAAECAKTGKKHLIIKAELSKENEAKDIIKQTIDAFGKLDILVNNAGIYRKDNFLDSHFIETFDEVYNTNMRSVAIISNVAAPYLMKTKGNIVNVSTISAIRVKTPNVIAYKVSKAALNHFTRCIALELAPFGVRVNSVSPGPVATDIFETAGVPDAMEMLKKTTALNRVNEAGEIADIILFLASDKARGITGADYITDNGSLLQ